MLIIDGKRKIVVGTAKVKDIKKKGLLRASLENGNSN